VNARKTALIKRYHSYLQQGPFIGEGKKVFILLPCLPRYIADLSQRYK